MIVPIDLFKLKERYKYWW